MEFARRQPTALGRLLAFGLMVLVGALVLLVAIPILLLMLIAGVFVWAWIGLKRRFSSAQEPNGILDGRRNVRVIMRDDEAG